jgi:histidine triad (HIT) family protein
MPECLFCKIATGGLTVPIVFEDEDSLVFLDHRPLFPGHCLVVPRRHFETMGDLPENQIGPLFATARVLCLAVEEGLGSEGSFLAVNNRVSQSVPHLHIHVVPRRRKDGLKGFFWPRGRYRDESDVEAVRVILRDAVERVRQSR